MCDDQRPAQKWAARDTDYVVVATHHGHCFDIGEIVRFTGNDSDGPFTSVSTGNTWYMCEQEMVQDVTAFESITEIETFLSAPADTLNP